MVEARGTVFVVDDDEAVRSSLSRLLRVSGYEVECFDSAESYLQRPAHDGAGCLLVDLRMPGLSGIQLQERLNALGSDLPLIFLSAHGDVPSSVRAMKEGAVDFLTKPVDEKDLLAALDQALARHEELRRDRQHSLRSREALDQLTSRELEVLRHVIAGRMNKEIAEELGIAEKTVKAHRGQVKVKLGTGSVAELVRLCADAGIDPAGTQ